MKKYLEGAVMLNAPKHLTLLNPFTSLVFSFAELAFINFDNLTRPTNRLGVLF